MCSRQLTKCSVFIFYLVIEQWTIKRIITLILVQNPIWSGRMCFKRINRQNMNRRSTQRTLQANITSRTRNEQLATNSQYTQPSSCLNPSCKKRSRVGNHSIGLNLVKRFQQSSQNYTHVLVINNLIRLR